jgi:hypothetical protein
VIASPKISRGGLSREHGRVDAENIKYLQSLFRAFDKLAVNIFGSKSFDKQLYLVRVKVDEGCCRFTGDLTGLFNWAGDKMTGNQLFALFALAIFGLCVMPGVSGLVRAKIDVSATIEQEKTSQERAKADSERAKADYEREKTMHILLEHFLKNEKDLSYTKKPHVKLAEILDPKDKVYFGDTEKAVDKFTLDGLRWRLRKVFDFYDFKGGR